MPNYLQFGTEALSRINVNADDVALRNMIDGAFTVEGWFFPTSRYPHSGGNFYPSLFAHFIMFDAETRYSDGLIYSSVNTDGANAITRSLTVMTLDQWNHLAFTYDDDGDRKIDIFIDGVEVSYWIHGGATGLVSISSGHYFTIGNIGTGYSNFAYVGRIGWCRVSSAVLYTESFTPPEMCTLPAIDGNTIAQWIGKESAPPSNVDNQEGTPGRDATAYDLLWGTDCPAEVARPGTFLKGVRLGVS